jgi:hypothetical protein
MNIDRDEIIMDIFNSNIEVSGATILTIKGMVNGTITIDKDSKVEIYGVVNGNIINSGTCVIWGMINGALIRNGGKFDVKPGASVGEP